PAPVEFIAAVIAYYVHPVNIQTACLIMEGAEFTENIINGVERPVKAAELFAFTLRVRAGNTDVLTDAEENVRQKLRAEGVDQKSGSAGMPRPISYAVLCSKKKSNDGHLPGRSGRRIARTTGWGCDLYNRQIASARQRGET